MPENTTIAQLFEYLAPGERLEELCLWPPDAFAWAASLLPKTGAYRVVVIEDYWGGQQSVNWSHDIKEIAQKWKTTAAEFAPPPPRVRGWWDVVLAARNLRLQEVYQNRTLCQTLLDLCAAADQTCDRVGVPVPRHTDHAFTQAANRLLGDTLDNDRGSSTLCMGINSRVVSVLPKLHTQQTGMTLRSLNHHLALCEVGEVSVQWAGVPARLADDDSRHGLNLLLVPWPQAVSPLDFEAVANRRCGRHPLATGNRYFQYHQAPGLAWLLAEFKSLVARASEQVGRIDGVILPELSMPSMDVYEHLYDSVTVVFKSMLLV